MQKKNIYFWIFVLIALFISGGLIYYLNKLEIPEIPVPSPEYSYKNLVYDFWGYVVVKEKDTVSVEGIIRKPGEAGENQAPQTIKFKITADTIIVKQHTVESENKEVATTQIFVGPETIQLKDHVGLKTDEIDTEKKEAVATDILILEPVPPMPLP